jgi:hypothetical protein
LPIEFTGSFDVRDAKVQTVGDWSNDFRYNFTGFSTTTRPEYTQRANLNFTEVKTRSF